MSQKSYCRQFLKKNKQVRKSAKQKSSKVLSRASAVFSPPFLFSNLLLFFSETDDVLLRPKSIYSCYEILHKLWIIDIKNYLHKIKNYWEILEMNSTIYH